VKTLWHLGWIGVMFMVAVMACTTTAPPGELIQRNDHESLATWYAQEAARLRDKAEEMRQMADMYAKPSYQPAPKESKTELIAHCQLFIKLYIEGAREAEALAKLHRDLDKTIP
jgi:hypothetical protein